MNNLFLLPSNKISVLRKLLPNNQGNELLASNGLAVGNNLDNSSSIHHIGTWIPEGFWPIYILSNNADSRCLMSKSDWLIQDTLVYRADIILESLKIGANAAFSKSGKEWTYLNLVQHKSGFVLQTTDDWTSLSINLKNRFNEDGYLLKPNIGDEFFISNYKGPRQLINEKIYRSDGKIFVDITNEVLSLRK